MPKKSEREREREGERPGQGGPARDTSIVFWMRRETAVLRLGMNQKETSVADASDRKREIEGGREEKKIMTLLKFQSFMAARGNSSSSNSLYVLYNIPNLSLLSLSLPNEFKVAPFVDDEGQKKKKLPNCAHTINPPLYCTLQTATKGGQ